MSHAYKKVPDEVSQGEHTHVISMQTKAGNVSQVWEPLIKGLALRSLMSVECGSTEDSREQMISTLG